MKWHEQFPHGGKGKTHPWLLEQMQRLSPSHTLDYGCGKGGTIRWLEQLGFRVTGYDPHWEPANQQQHLEQRYAVLYTQDVLEHIELDLMPWHTFQRCAPQSLHIIDLTPAKKTLADGRNAHITLLTSDDWLNLLEQHLGKIHSHTLDHQPDPNFTTRTRLCTHIEHWQ